MEPNIQEGYGLYLSEMLIAAAKIWGVGTTGKFFIVGASALEGYNRETYMWGGASPNGVPVVYTTIAAAVASCVASRGDVIFVMPGHTENITSSTYLNINIAGVSVIGLGTGNARPTLTITTAASALLTISAANCGWYNMILDGTGVASVTTMVSITAAGVTIKGCKFINANSTNQAGVVITTTATADQLTIDSNLFIGTTDAGTTNALQLIGSDDIVITNNYFHGAYTTTLGAINNITSACLRALIKDNTIINATTSATKAVVMLSSSTGMITGNKIGIGSGAAPFTFAAGWWAANWNAAAVATNGTLV